MADTAWPCGVCRCRTAWASSRPMWIAEWITKPALFTGWRVSITRLPSTSIFTSDEAVISSNMWV